MAVAGLAALLVLTSSVSASAAKKTTKKAAKKAVTTKKKATVTTLKTISAGPTGGGGQKLLTGEPIVLGNLLSPQFARRWIAVRAAVNAINADGGINGRPLKVVSCTPVTGDPNGAVNCMRDNIAAGMVVEIGDIGHTDAANALLQSSNVPSVGYATSTNDTENPIGFNWIYTPGTALGKAAVLAELGAKNISYANTTTPDSAGAASLQAVMNAKGVPNWIGVKALESTAGADLVPSLTAILKDNPDGILIASAEAGRVDTVLYNIGYKGYTSISCNVTTPAERRIINLSTDKAYCIQSYLTPELAPNNARLKQFTAEMNATDRSALQDDQSVEAWLETHWVADVMKTLKDPTDKKALIAAMSSWSSVDTGGITGPFGFNKGDSVAPYKRFFNPWNFVIQIKNGKLNLVTDKPFDFSKPKSLNL